MKPQIDNRKLLSWIPVVIFFGLVLNFLLFVVISLYLGGTAELGYVANGEYFLGSHGHYVEVSKAAFTFSQTYTEFTKATIPVAFIVFPFVLLNKSVRARLKSKK